MEGRYTRGPARDPSTDGSGGVRSCVDSSGLHGVGSEKSRRKQGPGKVRDPRRAQASGSGWGQQRAARQAGTGPLKLAKMPSAPRGRTRWGRRPHSAPAGWVQRPKESSGLLREQEGGFELGNSGWPGSPECFQLFFCGSLGFSEALVRKRSSPAAAHTQNAARCVIKPQPSRREKTLNKATVPRRGCLKPKTSAAEQRLAVFK